MREILCILALALIVGLWLWDALREKPRKYRRATHLSLTMSPETLGKLNRR